MKKIIFGGGTFFLALFTLFFYLRYQPALASAPDSSLSFSPQNISPDGQGKFQFLLGSDVSVNLMLQTGSSAVDSVETVIIYDPSVLSAKTVDFSTNSFPTLTFDAMKCNPVYVKRDGSNNETGIIQIARTAVPLPDCNPANISTASANILPSYTPVPASTSGVVATITFHPLKTATASAVNYDFTLGGKNDSNVTAFAGNGGDVLGSVTNLQFGVSSPFSGDVNGDGKVNIFDYNIFVPSFGLRQNGCTTNPLWNNSDLNADCVINIFDYNILVTNFGKSI